MNLNDLTTKLLFTTVPIWAEKQTGMKSATAFIYNARVGDRPEQSMPLLVMNYHVVENARRVAVEFVERKGNMPDTTKKLTVKIDPAQLMRYSDTEIDLAAIPIGPLLDLKANIGHPIFFWSIDPSLVPKPEVLGDLSAMEEIVFIGYPCGLRDEINSIPLIRYGITSTPVWNDFQGSPYFLIDAGVFPGSSGSPVFILNQGTYITKSGMKIGSRILFLGILSETMIRQSSSEVYLGIGKVLRSDVLTKFLSKVATSTLVAH